MDGGLDGFYVLVSGDPLSPTHGKQGKRNLDVDVLIFQAKVSRSFSGTAIDKLVSTLSTLFDLSRDMRELRRLYSEKLIERVAMFRDFYLDNIGNIGNMRIRVCYVTRGENPHPAFAPQVDTIETLCGRLFPGSDAQFEFIGAPQLLTLVRQPRPEWLTLGVSEDPLSSNGRGFISLAKLSDFAAFLTEGDGTRRRRLFLANVRDYEGGNRVNAAILETLGQPGADDFWTLNNGVTIVADEVRQGYRKLAMREPKIVNGLQTSMAIVEHSRLKDMELDDRSVMVRVVVPQDEAARDRIIVATNSQTGITAGVLRAAESIHADIEDYFNGTELVYERRRNSYRNEGFPLDKIVTIPQLARAVTAALLQEPNLSAKVNSHTRLVADDRNYGRIFSTEYPLGTFLACARLTKRIEGFLGESGLDHEFEVYHGQKRKTQLWYTQWHVAMMLAVASIPGGRVTPEALARIDVAAIPEETIRSTIGRVNTYFGHARKTYRRTVYQLTKSGQLTDGLLKPADRLGPAT